MKTSRHLDTTRNPRPAPLPERVPARLPSLVQMEATTTGTRLRLIAAHRPDVPIEDRLECLLWSWPIRPAITSRPGNPLWTGTGDDEETLARKAAVMTRLDTIEYDLYPYEAPSMLDNTVLLEMCQDLCAKLRELGGVTVPDPGDDVLWLTTIFEALHGDRQRDHRRGLQDDVVNPLNPSKCRQVCKIGEQARDAAYLSVCTTGVLDSVRRSKAQVKSFIGWLRDAGDYEEFVEENMNIAHIIRAFYPDAQDRAVAGHRDINLAFHEDRTAFYRAYQDLKASSQGVLAYLGAAFEDIPKDAERDRRARAGKPARPWVTQADRALKDLGLPPLDRTDLLQAWGLKLIPDDPPRTQ